MTMHDFVNHATTSDKTQCEYKSPLSHNCTQCVSLNIHKIRVQILDRLSVTLLMFHENIFIVKFFRDNSYFIPYRTHDAQFEV